MGGAPTAFPFPNPLTSFLTKHRFGLECNGATAKCWLLSTPLKIISSAPSHGCLITSDQIAHRLWSFCSARLGWARKSAALVGAIMNIHLSPHLTFSNQLSILLIQCLSPLNNIFLKCLHIRTHRCWQNIGGKWLNLFICPHLLAVQLFSSCFGRDWAQACWTQSHKNKKHSSKKQNKTTAQISTNRVEIE